ncbi:MAG: LysR family transcriptional regulator [Chloroflexi bacterium]|nr:LysR family transcriptional regulator [Chloroflexota bacterium]
MARLGGFTKASESLYISQPAVSAQVKALERAVGAPLVEREGRNIRLTEVGRFVYEHGQQIFAIGDSLGRGVDALLGLETGRLAIAASTTPGDYLLPPIIGAFKERHPKVEVELRIANTQVIIRSLAQREVDLGFIGDPVKHPDLTLLQFRLDEIALFVDPKHPWARRKNIGAKDLAGAHFVVREPGSATRKWSEESLRSLGVRYTVAMELGSNEAVKRAVMAGLGVGLLSRFALDLEVATGAIRSIPVRGFKSQRWLYVVHNRHAHFTPTQQAFLSLAGQSARSS